MKGQKGSGEGMKASKEAAQFRDLDRVRGTVLRRAYAEAEAEAGPEFRVLRGSALFVTGVTLYGTGGTKGVRNQIRFSSADPVLVKIFIQFLVRSCGVPVDKIRALLLVYGDLDEETGRRFWSFATGLPQARFLKSTRLPARKRDRELSQGVCTVLVSSAYLKIKLDRWSALLRKELIEQG